MEPLVRQNILQSQVKVPNLYISIALSQFYIAVFYNNFYRNIT